MGLKKEALEHWNKIACGSSTEAPDAMSCPFCREFIFNDCIGCQIYELTYIDSCGGTPYYAIWNSFSERDGIGPWQAEVADEIEAMIELIESLQERNDGTIYRLP